ncbi:MAG: RHS repeat-associated core domain-containing protein [Candidatus Omnitrophica bacterium]|nr:RHS repeat-associated core domain-containing protein [Candidatus Omnitrophota bacterium]
MAVSGTLGTTGTFEYDYNDIYELEGVSNADSHSYAYDNVGNRTTVDSVSYTTNELNEYTQVGSTSFTYDGNDNLNYDGTNSYTYDEANRLISASNSSHSATYKYDAFNRRISKTVDSVTTYYVYDANEVIEENNSSNVLQADYVMGSRIDEPLTMTRSSTTYYYLTDGLGSVRQLTNSSGTIVESYDYDPYGQVTIYNSSLTDITSSGSGIDNPYMFTGRRLDEETSVYHYRARQYDPAIGRFLQRDPLGYYDSMNLYEYGMSNPINWIDPFGLECWVSDDDSIRYYDDDGYPVYEPYKESKDNGKNDKDDGPVEEYDTFEDAVGKYGDDTLDVEDKLATKQPKWKKWGYTEKWIGRDKYGQTCSVFYNPKKKKFSGGGSSSRK